MGLRHSLGILAETRVDFDITNSIEEALQSAAVNRRRVHSHSVIAAEGLRFLGERGEEAAAVTRAAAIAKAKEGAERSAPVYFGGADNQDPAADQIVDPPPCGYALTAGQYGEVAGTLALLGAKPRVEADGSATVLMAQAAEPLIPLLLDSGSLPHTREVAGSKPAAPIEQNLQVSPTFVRICRGKQEHAGAGADKLLCAPTVHASVVPAAGCSSSPPRFWLQQSRLPLRRPPRPASCRTSPGASAARRRTERRPPFGAWVPSGSV